MSSTPNALCNDTITEGSASAVPSEELLNLVRQEVALDDLTKQCGGGATLLQTLDAVRDAQKNNSDDVETPEKAENASKLARAEKILLGLISKYPDDTSLHTALGSVQASINAKEFTRSAVTSAYLFVATENKTAPSEAQEETTQHARAATNSKTEYCTIPLPTLIDPPPKSKQNKVLLEGYGVRDDGYGCIIADKTISDEHINPVSKPDNIDPEPPYKDKKPIKEIQTEEPYIYSTNVDGSPSFSQEQYDALLAQANLNSRDLRAIMALRETPYWTPEIGKKGFEGYSARKAVIDEEMAALEALRSDAPMTISITSGNKEEFNDAKEKPKIDKWLNELKNKSTEMPNPYTFYRLPMSVTGGCTVLSAPMGAAACTPTVSRQNYIQRD